MSSYDKDSKAIRISTSKSSSIAKINEILGNKLKNFSEKQQDDLIARLAVIGLRSLQLESKEPLQMSSIVPLSDKAAAELEENTNGTLRMELSSIKEQLSQLTNRFQTMHQEKPVGAPLHQENRPDTFDIKQLNNKMAVSATMQKENHTMNSSNWKGPIVEINEQQSVGKAQSKISEQSDTASSVRSPRHKPKLFESEEQSSLKGANFNKKPSSAWRTGERSTSANKQAALEGNCSESAGDGSLCQSQSNHTQKRSSSKSHESIAQKVTEVVPPMDYHRADSRENLHTRHHLDDKLIKDALWEHQYDPSAAGQQKLKNRLDSEPYLESSEKASKKKWEINRQNSNNTSAAMLRHNNQQIISPGELTYEEMGGITTPSGSGVGSSGGTVAQEFVSLSQPQQFMAQGQAFQSFYPIPNSTQSQSTLPSLAQQQQQMFQSNPSFASPKFRESGRETTTQTQSSAAASSAAAAPNNLDLKRPPMPPGQSSCQPSAQHSLNNLSTIPSKKQSNSGHQTAVAPPAPKYGITNTLKKRQELNLQKKKKDEAAAAAAVRDSKRKNSSFSSSSSQPSYLRNVTSKIRDDIRLARETSRANQHSNNPEVMFFFKNPPNNGTGQDNDSHQAYNTEPNEPELSDHFDQYANEFRTQMQYDLPPMPDVDESLYSGFQDEFSAQGTSDQQQSQQQQQQFYPNRHGYNGAPMWNSNSDNGDLVDDYRTSNAYPFGIRHQDSALPYDQDVGDDDDDNSNEVIGQYNNNHRRGDLSEMTYGYGGAEDDDQNENNISDMNPLQQQQSTAMRYRFSGQGDQSSFYSHHNISGMSHNNVNINNNRSTATAFTSTPNNSSLMKIANKFLSSPMMNQISTIPHSHTTLNQRRSSSSVLPTHLVADQDRVSRNGGEVFYQQEEVYDDQDDSSFKVSGYSHQKQQRNNQDHHQNYFGGVGLSQTKNFGAARNNNGGDSEQSSMLNGNITNNNIADQHEDTGYQHGQYQDDEEMVDDDDAAAEKQNTSLSSSFAPFEPDHDMKILLQKDGFFKKIFDGDERNMSAASALGDNIPNSYGNSFTNVNYQRDESIILPNDVAASNTSAGVPASAVNTLVGSNANRFSHQHMEYVQQQAQNLTYGQEEEEADDNDDRTTSNNTSIAPESRLKRFFVAQHK